MKQEAPQIFMALMTEVTNLVSDLVYETLFWMQHLTKKNNQIKQNKQQSNQNPQRPQI